MKNILVPLDLSQNCDTIISYAVKFAQRLESKITFFQSEPSLLSGEKVMDDTYSYEDVVCAGTLLSRKIRQRCQKLGLSLSSVDAEYEVKYGGNPVDDILEITRAGQIDLIIMLTHANSGFRRFFLGSTTAAIVTRAKVPVLVLPLNYKFRPIYKIIYSCDLENVFREYNQVLGIAKQIKASLEIITFSYGLPNPEAGLLKLLKSKNIEIKEIQRDITLTLVQQMRDYMNRKSNCIWCMFTKPRTVFEQLYDGSSTCLLLERLRFPLLSLPKNMSSKKMSSQLWAGGNKDEIEKR